MTFIVDACLVSPSSLPLPYHRASGAATVGVVAIVAVDCSGGGRVATCVRLYVLVGSLNYN